MYYYTSSRAPPPPCASAGDIILIAVFFNMTTGFEKKVFDAQELAPAVALIIGTRPGIIMLSPLIKELGSRDIDFFTIHTGQHYSPNMDSTFFEDLELPQPDYRIQGVSEKRTHGGQTAAMLVGIENILMERRPCIVLVGGDANTNLSGALAARKLRMNLGHIEAGERSYDRTMPEEHNRVIIDHISDYLFVTGDTAVNNLKKEGIIHGVYKTGNPIVDASLQNFELAQSKSSIIRDQSLQPGRFAVMTMHREENVDSRQRLHEALEGVSNAAQKHGFPVIFSAHPRTLKRLKEFGLLDWAEQLPGIRTVEAVGYLDFLSLLGNSMLVFTDSGGVQQEACIHRIPCITLRENTEWTETLQINANRLSGCNAGRIADATAEALNSDRNWDAPFGDGRAAEYIADIVVEEVKKHIVTGAD